MKLILKKVEHRDLTLQTKSQIRQPSFPRKLHCHFFKRLKHKTNRAFCSHYYFFKAKILVCIISIRVIFFKKGPFIIIILKTMVPNPKLSQFIYFLLFLLN